MARAKNEDKRKAIVAEARRLFARSGFENSSMVELAKGVGIPVGSLYTYFQSQDALLETIIEEGWGEFRAGLEAGFAALEEELEGKALSAPPSLYKLSFLAKTALPELFKDYDLIAIIMAQAGKGSMLGDKLEYLAESIRSILLEYARTRNASPEVDLASLRSGLAVMLLGSLEAVRLGYHQALDIGTEDIIGFLSRIIEASLGCSLPELGPAWKGRGFSS